MLKGTQAYVQTKYNTVGQGEILLMLYDGALKFLNGAKEKIEARDYATKGILISKTMDIVHELDSSLNMELGGDLAKNLHQLYFLCSTRLLQANLKMDVALIDSVIGILAGLRDAYAQIINTPEAMAAAEKIATRLAPASSAQSKNMALPTRQVPTGATRSTMRTAYAQQAVVPTNASEAATSGTMPTTASPVSIPASSVVPPLAASAAPILEPVATPDTSRIPSAPRMPDIPVIPTAAPGTPVNLASRRLAATARYGKVSESM